MLPHSMYVSGYEAGQAEDRAAIRLRSRNGGTREACHVYTLWTAPAVAFLMI